MKFVDDCEIGSGVSVDMSKVEKAVLEADRLRTLGFETMAQKIFDEATRKTKLARVHDGRYPVITQKKIDDFITRETRQLHGNIKPVTGDSLSSFQGLYGAIGGIGYQTIRPGHDFQTTNSIDDAFSQRVAAGRWTEFFYHWDELPVKSYPGIPPEPVLQRLASEIEKDLFDYYTVASVSLQRVKQPDPLLLGRIHGVDDRFFIAQWGDDVALDDVI